MMSRATPTATTLVTVERSLRKGIPEEEEVVGDAFIVAFWSLEWAVALAMRRRRTDKTELRCVDMNGVVYVAGGWRVLKCGWANQRAGREFNSGWTNQQI